MRLIAYYAHPERGRKYEREDAARVLNEFQRYYVTKVDVGQSYTKVWLYGFGQELGDGFNSVFFDFYCEETKRGVDVPYELERPTVLGLFDVSELSVRGMEEKNDAALSRNGIDKLKPCPFCGEDGEIEVGEMWNPAAYWDSGIRGESCGYVTCNYCKTVIVKGDTLEDAVRNWNRRAAS